ncbi:MAG: hypothetical protein U1F98_05705 [Verrucomicrobiota bacterium]
MKKTKTTKSLAEIHGVTARTIRNWKAQGAPVNDPSALSAWLAGRRQPPRGSKPGSTFQALARDVLDAIPPAKQAKQATGAAAALRRLEQQEADDYSAYLRAVEGGDMLQARIAHDRWLKTAEALRRHDLAIEQARRDAGELVPRSEMLRLCHFLHDAIYHATSGMELLPPRLAGLGCPHKVWAILSKTRDDIHGAIHAWLARPWRDPLPDWMVRAVTMGAFPLPSAEDRDAKVADMWRQIIAEMHRQAGEKEAEAAKK